MSFKIDCKIVKIYQNSSEGLDVYIDPCAQYRVQRKNPIDGNAPTDFALFIDYEYFSSTKDKYNAALVKIGDQGIALKLKLSKESFNYSALCAAQATKGRTRLMVNDNLTDIESVDMV